MSPIISNCVLRRTRYKKTQKRRLRVKLHHHLTHLQQFILIKFPLHFSLPYLVILKKRPLVCQFASPLDVDIHNTPQVSDLFPSSRMCMIYIKRFFPI